MDNWPPPLFCVFFSPVGVIFFTSSSTFWWYNNAAREGGSPLPRSDDDLSSTRTTKSLSLIALLLFSLSDSIHSGHAQQRECPFDEVVSSFFIPFDLHSFTERARANQSSFLYTSFHSLVFFKKPMDRQRERGDEGISRKYITNRDLSLLFLYIVSIQHHHTTSFMIYRPFRFLFCSFFPFVSFILFPNT